MHILLWYFSSLHHAWFDRQTKKRGSIVADSKENVTRIVGALHMWCTHQRQDSWCYIHRFILKQLLLLKLHFVLFARVVFPLLIQYSYYITNQTLDFVRLLRNCSPITLWCLFASSTSYRSSRGMKRITLWNSAVVVVVGSGALSSSITHLLREKSASVSSIHDFFLLYNNRTTLPRFLCVCVCVLWLCACFYLFILIFTMLWFILFGGVCSSSRDLFHSVRFLEPASTTLLFPLSCYAYAELLQLYYTSVHI